MKESAKKAGWTYRHRQEGDSGLVTFSGAWVKARGIPDPRTIRSAIEQGAELKTLILNADHLEGWDSALLPVVRHLDGKAREQGWTLQFEGFPEGVENLLRLSQSVPRAAAAESSEAYSFLEQMGKNALAAFSGVGAYCEFLGRFCVDLVALFLGRGHIRRKDFWMVLQSVGAQAVPIVSLLSFLTGLIIAFIGVIQLQKFGADIYVADLVGLAATRELGAVMAGVIMAGRTGAAFAAQIGSMQVNEEVDALKTFGISPMQFLVLPRVVGLVLMLPLLCACANLMAILGGMVVAVMISDVSIAQYGNQIQEAVGLSDLFVGIFKSSVFGLIIALAGCFRGLNCGRDASSVGRAATSAVVTSITWIVIADAIFAVLFQIIGI